MILGVLAATLIGGLAVADFTIAVGEMATDGAFIYPAISDRRLVLRQKIEEAERLEGEFLEKIARGRSLASHVRQSLPRNQRILSNLASLFECIDDRTLTALESRSPELFGTPASYLLGSFEGLVSPDQNASAYMEQVLGLRDRIGFVGKQLLEIRHLHFAQKALIDTRSGAVLQPFYMDRLKALGAALNSQHQAAVSIVSMSVSVAEATQRLDELNARIEGVQNVIDLLQGRIEPDAAKLGEESLPNRVSVYSLPQVNALLERLEEAVRLDLDAFRTLVVELLELASSIENVASDQPSLVARLVNALLEVGPIGEPSDIDVPFMVAAQVKLDSLLLQARLDLNAIDALAAQTSPAPPVITESDRQTVRSACTYLAPTLGRTATQDYLEATQNLPTDITDQIIKEDLADRCGVK